MTTLEQAYALYRQELSALPAEFVPVEAAVARVACETVRAVVDVPDADRGGMDSYSWFSAEVIPASVMRPMALKKGMALVRPGRRLSADKLREFIDAGLDQVQVSCRPRIQVLVVGDEPIDESVLPRKKQLGGGSMIDAMLQRWGYELTGVALVGNEPLQLQPMLDAALKQADLVIATSGAPGRGHNTLLTAALGSGVRMFFRGVEHTPGPSIAFGSRDRRGLLILPSSPGGILIGMTLHARYILDCLEGQLPAGSPWSPGVLASAIEMPSDMVRFALMRLYINEAGVARLFPAPDDADADIDPLALRDVVAWIPADEVPVPIGSIIYWTELIH